MKGGIREQETKCRTHAKVKQKKTLPGDSAPINPNQSVKLVVSERGLWDHQPHHPVWLVVLDAHIPPRRVHRPIGLIIRPQKEA